MDILMIGALALVGTNITFAVLWLKQRQTIAGQNESIAHLQTNHFQEKRRERDDGLLAGWKRAWGECYAVAQNAELRGTSPTDAIRRLGTLHEAQSKRPEMTIQV